MEEFVSRCSYDDSLRVGNENHRRGRRNSFHSIAISALAPFFSKLSSITFIIVDRKTRSRPNFVKYRTFLFLLSRSFAVLYFNLWRRVVKWYFLYRFLFLWFYDRWSRIRKIDINDKDLSIFRTKVFILIFELHSNFLFEYKHSYNFPLSLNKPNNKNKYSTYTPSKSQITSTFDDIKAT